MTFLCIACSTSDDEVAFNSAKELSEHVKGGHKTRPKKVLPPPLPRSLRPSATELANAHVKKEEAAPTPPVKEEPIPLKPLELTYQWIGQCPTCRNDVRTIPVMMQEMSIQVAYCVTCSKELAQMQVIPITKQFPSSDKAATKKK